MDKYEYKACADEIRNLISEQEYEKAAEIADTIDWRRVKSVSMLCTISDLYKVNHRYQESKEILQLAYERHPEGPRIIYSLCELSIKLGDPVQALEYYKQFVSVAPRESRQYILKYKMYVAQDVNLGERIEILEELKKVDYREKWAYELAYLYHRTGEETKCVSECDEIFAWFGEGRYVRKALELKELHQPLSEIQQARLDAWRGETEPSSRTDRVEATTTEEQAPEDEDDVEITKVLPNISNLMNSDRPLTPEEQAYVKAVQNADTVPLPSHQLVSSIEAKIIDVGRGNTINLQQDLAENMRQLYANKDELEAQQNEDVTGYDENSDDPAAAEPEGGAYAGQEGYGEGGAYAVEEGYGEDGTYAGEEGYAEDGAYAGEEGYAEDGTYAGEEGYPEDGTYTGEEGYAEGGTYAGEEGYPEDGTYAGQEAPQAIDPGPGPGAQDPSIFVGLTQELFDDTSSQTESRTEDVPYYGSNDPLPEYGDADSIPDYGSRYTIPEYDGSGVERVEPITADQAEEEVTGEAYEKARELMHLIKRDTDEILKSSDQSVDMIPGARTGTLTPLNAGPTRIDGMLLQNVDGQITINVPDSEKLDRQITGQMDIGDVLDEWEKVTKENEQKRRDEIKERILKNTGSLFSDFDEATRNGLLEQLQQAFVSSMTPDEAEGRKEYTPAQRHRTEREENARIKAAAVRAAEEQRAKDRALTEAGGAEADEIPADYEGYEDAPGGYETPADEPAEESGGYQDDRETYEETTGATDDEPVAEDTDEPAAEEDEDANASPEAPENDEGDTADEEMIRRVSEAIDVREDQGRQEGPERTPAEKKGASEKNEAVRRALTDEEKQLFGRFIKSKKERAQIINALDKMSMAAYAGNVVIMGSREAGTVDLAKALIREMRAQDANFTGRVAKINGKTLAQKDSITGVIEQIKGGALIIERAAAMGDDKAKDLCAILENSHDASLIILTDRKDRLRTLFTHTPALKKVFDIRIVMRPLDDDALVEYARTYAESREYVIDEFGFLALHERIAGMQTADHEVTVAEIREMVDDAIYWAEKKNLSFLLKTVTGKRYDKNDMVILHEKDFQHYR
ncbi:MAG: hypothetical protein IJT00_10615 [Lachnospiraceae bacterium]|nr:hypothetical protein [Lachnospiraceae bacterium]